MNLLPSGWPPSAAQLEQQFEAHGGMSEFYRAARRMYDYAGRDRQWIPPRPARVRWLGQHIRHLELLLAQQLYTLRDVDAAIQTRQAISAALDELGPLIEGVGA